MAEFVKRNDLRSDYTLRRVFRTRGFVALAIDLADERLRDFSGIFSACAAIEIVSGSAAAGADDSFLRSGRRCFNVSKGANKSPIFSTRFTVCIDSKISSVGSFFLRACSTSCQVTGVETVGRSLARSE